MFRVKYLVSESFEELMNEELMKYFILINTADIHPMHAWAHFNAADDTLRFTGCGRSQPSVLNCIQEDPTCSCKPAGHHSQTIISWDLLEIWVSIFNKNAIYASEIHVNLFVYIGDFTFTIRAWAVHQVIWTRGNSLLNKGQTFIKLET